MSLAAKFWSVFAHKTLIQNAYFAIILPGNATLTVHSLPLVGWNIAVGLVVSTSAWRLDSTFGVPLGTGFESAWRFRFYYILDRGFNFETKKLP